MNFMIKDTEGEKFGTYVLLLDLLTISIYLANGKNGFSHLSQGKKGSKEGK